MELGQGQRQEQGQGQGQEKEREKEKDAPLLVPKKATKSRTGKWPSDLQRNEHTAEAAARHEHKLRAIFEAESAKRRPDFQLKPAATMLTQLPGDRTLPTTHAESHAIILSVDKARHDSYRQSRRQSRRQSVGEGEGEGGEARPLVETLLEPITDPSNLLTAPKRDPGTGLGTSN